MKKLKPFLILISVFLISSCSSVRKPLPVKVDENTMSQIYNRVKTPYKYGLVMVSGSHDVKYDCPTIFRKDGHWIMTYIEYQGQGYETHLAQSDDLIHWQKEGKLLSFSDTTDWDCNQKAGYPSLIDYSWGGDYSILPWHGKYWMSYFGGNTRGYERGVLSVGMAFTTDDPAIVHEWNRLDSPVLTPLSDHSKWYDNSTMYKNSIIADSAKLTGHSFVMYYNARGDSLHPEKGAERISMAVSDDMVHWTRYAKNPLINHNTGICGDAVIQKIGEIYVMFFFGAFWPDQDYPAFNRFACSYDLMHWTEWTGPNLIQPSEDYDALFAHKSCVLKWKGVVYHFYNAVDKQGNRGVALATSKDLGKSTISFPVVTKVNKDDK